MKTHITIVLCLVSLSLWSQDIHFSQSHLSPINLNPAETGNYNGDYRLHLNHRNQWRSITIPYITFSASLENKWKKISFLSTGLIFNTDKAGDGHFGTNQIGLSASYKLPTHDSTLRIALGLIAMWNQHSVDYSKFYFDNQYNGYMYDPSIAPNELFTQPRMNYFDVHSGIRIQKIIKRIPVSTGIAFYHINKPRKTFYRELDVKLDRKFTVYFLSELPLSKQTILLPHVYWFQQNMLREIYAGGYLYRKTTDYSFKGYYIGGWFRIGDAAILSAAIDYQDFHLAISYDFNISPLVAASNGRGGLEIAIRYIFSRPQQTLIFDKHICPTFL
ncbi:MAG: PorP/SprF family type IX secretion system membrane protein [Bacteroidales bacterium]|nr:PorP/SprF family type IX secretion system membrane protein [Bacteroidales bacterium]